MSKNIKIIMTILIIIVLGVIIAGGVYIIKLNNKVSEQENIINSLKSENSNNSEVEKNDSVVVSNEINDNSINENKTNSNVIENNVVNNELVNETDKTSGNNSTDNKNDNDSDYITVNREGMEDKVYMKKYESTLGYSMRYDPETFKVSSRSGVDWYEQDNSINCIVVLRENVAYKDEISKLTNTTETKINGKNAVYITYTEEGQSETEYYIDGGENVTFIVTTTCQNSSEHAEGLEILMKAMLGTFTVK